MVDRSPSTYYTQIEAVVRAHQRNYGQIQSMENTPFRNLIIKTLFKLVFVPIIPSWCVRGRQ